MTKEQKCWGFVCFSDSRVKDTVFVKDELNELLRTVGERNCRVVGETTTFLGLQRHK